MVSTRGAPWQRGVAVLLLTALTLTSVPLGGASEAPDTTPPDTRVTIPAPGAGGWYANQLTLHIEPHDLGGSGVWRTYVTLGGANVVRVGGAPFDLLLRNDGTTAVTIYGVDNAGNVETPIVFDVRIDTVRPQVTLTPETEVLAGIWFEGDAATLTATATDALSGVGHVEFHVWTTTGYSVILGKRSAQDKWEGTWDTSGLEPQLVEVTALAKDVAGNWAASPGNNHLILPRA